MRIPNELEAFPPLVENPPQDRQGRDMHEIISIVGKQSDDPPIVNLLGEFGFTDSFTYKPGENRLYLHAYEKGVSLLFEPIDYTRLDLPHNSLILSSAFFYGPGNSQFCAYPGELINGLNFSDSEVEAGQKLGDLYKYSYYLRFGSCERIPGVKVGLKYHLDEQSIAYIQVDAQWNSGTDES